MNLVRFGFLGLALGLLGLPVACGQGVISGDPPGASGASGTGGSGQCPAGSVSCSGACVDVLTSSTNCGQCGRACAAGQSCTAGTCTCLGGGTDCGGGCVDTSTSNTHCGACGRACGTGEQCSAGTCQCTGGLTSCAGTCTDTNSNADHCGTCGVACPDGLLCSLGQCKTMCDPGLTGCGPSGQNCVDLNSDEFNCGSCGTQCGSGKECVGGSCVCSDGRTDCGAAGCVDTTSDALHCNGCGVACAVGQSCEGGQCRCPDGETVCGGACVDTSSDGMHCGGCNQPCAGTCVGGMCMGGTGGAGGSGGSAGGGAGAAGTTGAGGSAGAGTGGTTGTGGSGGGSAGTGGSAGSGGSGGSSSGGACEPGTTNTAWATSCPTSPPSCTPGTWTARPQGSDGHPLRHESAHFAIYWHTSDPDGGGPLRGVASPPSSSTVQNALNTLESLWNAYFGSPIFFPEPYCNSSTKTKAAVHIDDYYPLWGGGWGSGYMGLWIGPGALNDQWGLAHEFMHGVQSTTQAFPDCGGVGCWIFESHANWMPHQIHRSNVHCSEMLVNAPHLYYGNTRDRYCNWQFFEFLKDKYCYKAVNDMWAYQAPTGQRDPWQKLMSSRGWNMEQLNDVFGEWAMHNITWDYKNPPPTDGSDQGSVYRNAYGSIEDTQYTERRLRLTRLEPLDGNWAQNRRFASPYYWAPQRWGYNVIRLHPDPGASSVRVTFRGVTQNGANSGWRWGLVATNSGLTTARYSALRAGADGELDFCVDSGENLYLVVLGAPTTYERIAWTNPSDGPAYPSLYRYPYMIQLERAWPAGFQNGQLEACPNGTQRHSNGGGCAPAGTPSSVYVGPYARILGGSVSGNARIEDQATVVSGNVSGGTVGGLSLIGLVSHPGVHGAASFNVSGSAVVKTTFYPLGWFGNGQSVSGTARLLGDVEFVASSKSSNTFYGFVPNDWNGVSSVTEVTVAPPYTWRP